MAMKCAPCSAGLATTRALSAAQLGTPVGTQRRRPHTPGAGWQAAPRTAALRFATNHVAAGALPRARVQDAGEALPPALRARLPPIVGARATSAVRVHTGPAAHARASAEGARALAEREHVFFAHGEYRPGTPAGDALIAHELAHVDQAQRGLLRKPARKALSGAEHSALEAAADQVSTQLAAGADSERRPVVPRKTKSVAGAAPAAASAPPLTAAVLQPLTAPGSAPLPASAGVDNARATVPPSAAAQNATLPRELPLMPEPATELSGQERARVSAVQRRAQSRARATASAPAATQNVAAAQASVAVPQQESDARAAQQVVSKLADRAPPSPEIVALCERIRTLIREKRPADEDAVIDTRPQEVAQAAGGAVEGDVRKNVDDANASYGALNRTPAGAAPPAPPALQPLPAESLSPPLHATAATPDPVPAARVNLDADRERMEAQANSAGLDQETARLVQNGPVADARAARGDMATLSKDGPADALKQQQAALAQADSDMAALQQKALQALHATRQGHATSVKRQQREFTGGEESLRINLSDAANRIFLGAQTLVQTLLAPVHEVAMNKWSTRLPLISKRFNDELRVVKDKIDERHSGIGGFFVSGWDAATGLPGWVTDAYDQAEQNFGHAVCDLIIEISSDVNTVIKACDAIIDAALAQISRIFSQDVPESLKAWAAEQQKGFQSKLDRLRDKAASTRTKFNQELIDSAGNAVQAARERIQKLRQEAKGLWSRFRDALGKFLRDPLKYVIDGLLDLVGISPKAFWSLVDKISQVISDIAWHPVRFISNLMDGVSAGFDRFFKNFAKHFEQGFFEWLFQGIKQLGVEVPRDFSLRSILTFFLQLMGISWARILQMLADVIGEKNVAAAEKVLKLGEIIARGPQGIVDFLKDQLKPETLIGRVLELATRYVIDTLIKQVAKYIIKLLSPVGAILAAIETIYKILKWIFHNAARIVHFIEAVVNALAAVVAGAIGVVAVGVESGLAMLVPPVIDFLAELVSLDDLPEQIAKIVKGLQGWVEDIIKSIIKVLAESAKALLASLGLGGKGKGKDEKTQQDKGQIGETLAFTSGGETHHLYIDVSGTNATVMVSSTPMTLTAWLDSLVNDEIPKLLAKDQKRANDLVASARQQLVVTDADADSQAAAQNATDASATGATASKVSGDEATLRNTLAELGELFGKPMIVKSLSVPGPAQVTQYTDALLLDIESTTSGTDIHAEPTGPDFIKSLLQRRASDVHFDADSGALAVPGAAAAPLGAASSARAMGDVASKATGVARVQLRKGKSDLTLTGFIDEARANVATGDAPPFKTIVHDVLGDKLTIKAGESRVQIRDGEGVRIAERFIAAAPVFDGAKTAAGRDLLRKTQQTFTGTSEPIEKLAARGWYAPSDRQLLSDGPRQLVAIVTDFVLGLDITNLKRASSIERTQLDTVVFNMSVPPAVVGNPVYEKNFTDEVQRQLMYQQAGQNKLTVDNWVVNVATYKAPNQPWMASLGSATRLAVLQEIEARIRDAQAEAVRETQQLRDAQETAAELRKQLETSKVSVAQAIAAITSDAYIRNQFTGRWGNEVQWRAEHSEAIEELLPSLEPGWAGLESRTAGYIKNAITHNADQVGGGEGKLPDIAKVVKPKPGEDPTAWNEYLAQLEPYIGAAKVNSRIGAGWGHSIAGVFETVTKRHPKEASYPLWLMNFKLDVHYE